MTQTVEDLQSLIDERPDEGLYRVHRRMFTDEEIFECVTYLKAVGFFSRMRVRSRSRTISLPRLLVDIQSSLIATTKTPWVRLLMSVNIAALSLNP